MIGSEEVVGRQIKRMSRKGSLNHLTAALSDGLSVVSKAVTMAVRMDAGRVGHLAARTAASMAVMTAVYLVVCWVGSKVATKASLRSKAFG